VTEKRKKTLRTWIKQESEIDFVEFFNIVNDSDFLSGRNGVWSGCSFDWILKPENRIKILEGNYKNKGDDKSDLEKELGW
jgi:hypothetical protein